MKDESTIGYIYIARSIPLIKGEVRTSWFSLKLDPRERTLGLREQQKKQLIKSGYLRKFDRKIPVVMTVVLCFHF